MTNSLVNSGDSAGIIIIMMVFVGLFFFIFLCEIIISVAFYLLEAFGINKMSKTCGLQRPWLAFIPVANSYALGLLAEQYRGEKIKPFKFGKWMLTAGILQVAILILYLINAVIQMSVTMQMAISQTFSFNSIYFFLAQFVIGALTAVVSIAVSILTYIALWRIFKLFDQNNAALYLLLSIFIPLALPVILFIIRNNKPAFPPENMPFNASPDFSQSP